MRRVKIYSAYTTYKEIQRVSLSALQDFFFCFSSDTTVWNWLAWKYRGKRNRRYRWKTKIKSNANAFSWLKGSVADPNPDPDPRVFGPPGSGSGSTCQRYGSGSGSCSGSGSGSFYHLAKIVRKTLIPPILWLFLNFYLKKNCLKKLVFCWHLECQWLK